jgi:hypothetical protein
MFPEDEIRLLGETAGPITAAEAAGHCESTSL